jgi:F-type H+-transporting ATPase subunit b
MRQDFSFNFNFFETNILNLAVVIRVIVVGVGGELRSLLEQRRATILAILQEAELKSREAQKRLIEAQAAVEIARLRAQDMRMQAARTIEQDILARRQQLEIDLQRLRENRQRAIQLERQQRTQSIAQLVIDLALTTAKTTLLITFGSQDSPKQRELNEIYVREALQQIK